MSVKKAPKSGKTRADGGRKAAVYAALVQGAQDGLTGDALFAHVQEKRADVDSKRITRAGLQALGDPKLTEKPVLDAIYALIITHRLAGKKIEAKPEKAVKAKADKIKAGKTKPDKAKIGKAEAATPAKPAGNDDAPKKKPRKKAA